MAQERIETLQDQSILSTEQQVRMLRHLADAENFNNSYTIAIQERRFF